jgi:hypothetical protein
MKERKKREGRLSGDGNLPQIQKTSLLKPKNIATKMHPTFS